MARHGFQLCECEFLALIQNPNEPRVQTIKARLLEPILMMPRGLIRHLTRGMPDSGRCPIIVKYQDSRYTVTALLDDSAPEWSQQIKLWLA